MLPVVLECARPHLVDDLARKVVLRGLDLPDLIRRVDHRLCQLDGLESVAAALHCEAIVELLHDVAHCPGKVQGLVYGEVAGQITCVMPLGKRPDLLDTHEVRPSRLVEDQRDVAVRAVVLHLLVAVDARVVDEEGDVQWEARVLTSGLVRGELFQVV